MADAGARAPALTLTAVGSGRKVDLAAPGLPLLLICFGQETQAGIEAVESVARERYPEASSLLIGHVVDLRKVPGLLRKVAEGVLAGEHKKAVEALEPGQAADDYVVIFPDWDGSTVAGLGMGDANKAIGLVLLSPDGAIDWSYQGPTPEAALRAQMAAF